MALIDLHIHTNHSDGDLSPKEVIDEAIKNNVKVISIADHDTTHAYTEELCLYAKKNNILLIPAVEISTKTTRCGIHILGYNMDINNEKFQRKLELIRNARHDYLYKVSNKLKELGFLIDVLKLDKIGSVTKAHIALDIINNELNKDKLLAIFNHIPSKGEFIEKLMNEGCVAYVEKFAISPKEAGELIKMAGGQVIVAHPVAYIYEDNLTELDILNLVKDIDAVGIEANYIYIDRNNKKINESKKWNDFAFKHNLLSTIGSDFHKKDFLHPQIGLIEEDIDTIDIDKIVNSLLN